MSLVDSCPSTEMRSNERFTHTPVSRSIVSAASPASVCTKQNIVAWRGEIMPAPFACAASRTDGPDGSATSRHARFGPASLVRIASAKSPASAASAPQAARAPLTTLSRGSSSPITPVDATPTWSGSSSSSSATARCIARAVSSPRSPSPTLEQPEFATTARRASSRASFDAITGAPTRAFEVKRAADVVVSAVDTSTPTSSPFGLSPAATPAEQKHFGSACGSSSVTCAGLSTQRERKNVT